MAKQNHRQPLRSGGVDFLYARLGRAFADGAGPVARPGGAAGLHAEPMLLWPRRFSSGSTLFHTGIKLFSSCREVFSPGRKLFSLR